MSEIGEYRVIDKIKTRNPNEKVFVAIRNSDNKKLIIKSFYKKNRSSYLSFFREKEVDFENEYLCKLVDVFESEEHYFIVRNFLKGSDLQKLNYDTKLRKKIILPSYIEIWLQTLKALKFLHNNKIIHRDIRLSNIMLLSENDVYTKKIKLIDYGMVKAKNIEYADNYAPYALIFSPPEQVLKLTDITNESSDLYSLAVSMWVLLTNKLPFSHQIPEIIVNAQISIDLPKIRKIPKEINRIIQKATYKYPLKKHPRFYKKKELREMMQEAQSKRYSTANEMIAEIKEQIK